MPSSCFNTVNALTQHREIPALLDELLLQLAKICPASGIQVYEILPGDATMYRLRGAEELWHLIDDPVLEQVCHSRQVVEVTGERILYPLSGAGRIKYVVALSGDLAGQQQVVQNLLQFVNQVYPLLDNTNHDALTGLLNRHAFDERMQRLINNRQQRHGEQQASCSFALLDIDHFKRVNDNFGHLYGDEVLILFAGIMEKTFRHDDMLFRYGGEEFAVLLKAVDVTQTRMILERFRRNVEQFAFPQVGKVTVSVGATTNVEQPTVVSIIECADRALYFSKDNGRNQVNLFEDLVAEGRLAGAAGAGDDIELF